MPSWKVLPGGGVMYDPRNPPPGLPRANPEQRCFEHHQHGPECFRESETERKLRALATRPR